jgi:hypothetical protein
MNLYHTWRLYYNSLKILVELGSITIFFYLDDADTKNKKMDANTKIFKGTLKKNENNRRIW